MDLKSCAIKIDSALTAMMTLIYDGMMWIWDKIAPKKYQIKRHEKNPGKQQRNIKYFKGCSFIVVSLLVICVVIFWPSGPTHQDQFDHILSLLEQITIQEQIEHLGTIYQQTFGHEFNTETLNNMIDGQSSGCMVLTPIAPPNGLDAVDSRYGFDTMAYAYRSKLRYSEKHSYPFIIDAFDYLDHFDIPRTELWQSPPISELMEYGGLSGIDIIKSYNDWNEGHKSSKSGPFVLNEESQRFEFNITVSNHWNKVLSLLYWSQYSNCILQTDDDAFIGNIELSIPEWTELSSSDTVFVMPHDQSNPDKVLYFSNFAFILHEKHGNAHNIQKLLQQWWLNRKTPFKAMDWMDQGAFWDALLQFESNHDVGFEHKFLSGGTEADKAKQDAFALCVKIQHTMMPQQWDPLGKCLGVFGIQRPTEVDLKAEQWEFSVLWSPITKFPISYFRQHDNLDEYQGIPIFALQLNFAFGADAIANKMLSVDVQADEVPFDKSSEYTSRNVAKILDKIFLLHYRPGKNYLPRADDKMIGEAINQMRSVGKLGEK